MLSSTRQSGWRSARHTGTTSALPALDQLVLVTTSDCHFCDHAHEVLDELGLDPREVDVGCDEAEGLAGRGIPLAFLPVLTDGERVIAYGRFSARRLRKELQL